MVGEQVGEAEGVAGKGRWTGEYVIGWCKVHRTYYQ